MNVIMNVYVTVIDKINQKSGNCHQPYCRMAIGMWPASEGRSCKGFIVPPQYVRAPSSYRQKAITLSWGQTEVPVLLNFRGLALAFIFLSLYYACLQ
jgi:hypothetical protein